MDALVFWKPQMADNNTTYLGTVQTCSIYLLGYVRICTAQFEPDIFGLGLRRVRRQGERGTEKNRMCFAMQYGHDALTVLHCDALHS